MTIKFKIKRTSLGLNISLLYSEQCFDVTEHQEVLYEDDTFKCGLDELGDLATYIQNERPDIFQRLSAGGTVPLFIPQADPQTIRVTNKNKHNAYFNIGELWRWRFLKHLPNYPFKVHQSTGVKWLCQQHSAILADDMGLGKTLQAIAALETMHRSCKIKNALVICPKTLIGVWEAEVKLWAPRLCMTTLYSSVSDEEWCSIGKQTQVAVTNYEAIRRHNIEPGTFDLVIFDEIHRLKNPKSLNYMAAYALNPKLTWGLSGTPLENTSGDLIAVLHLIDRKRISLDDRYLQVGSLRSTASNYILRRKKKVLGDELPNIIEKVEHVPLTDHQRKAYHQVAHHNIKTMGDWISIFNRLRNICDYDPATKSSSKIDRAETIVDAIKQLGEKLIIFSWRIEPLKIMQERLIKSYGGKSVTIITGQTRSTTRSKIVKSFQSRDLPFALLCSTRATAEGLTLTAANHVIFLNEWWNPAINSQARDRVNRIGQNKDVYVYKLRTYGTIEDRLDEILGDKQNLFESIIDKTSTDEEGLCQQIPPSLKDFI